MLLSDCELLINANLCPHLIFNIDFLIDICT